MPFTTPIPKPPVPPPIPTEWVEKETTVTADGRQVERFTGRLSRDAQDYQLKLRSYHEKLTEWFAALVAYIP